MKAKKCFCMGKKPSEEKVHPTLPPSNRGARVDVLFHYPYISMYITTNPFVDSFGKYQLEKLTRPPDTTTIFVRENRSANRICASSQRRYEALQLASEGGRSRLYCIDDPIVPDPVTRI